MPMPPAAEDPERPDRAAPEGSDVSDSAVRNTAFAFAAQFTTAAFTGVLVLFLTRSLGPGDFGLFTLAMSISALLLLPSDFGITTSVGRFVAERRNDREAAATIMAEGMTLKLVAGVAVSAALFAVADPIAAAYDQPDLAWPLRWAAVALLGQSVFAYYRYATLAVGKGSVGLRMVFVESFLEAAASIGLVLAGLGVAGAALGRAAGYVLGAAVAALLLARLLGRRSISASRPRPESTRRILGYAGAMLIIDAAYTALGPLNLLLIGALMSKESVGIFGAVLRVLALLSYPGLSVANGVAPRLARTEGGAPDVGSFVAGTRLMIVVGALLVAPLVLWAEPIVDLTLGSEYADAAEVLRALAPLAFVSGLVPLLSTGVDYLGEARRRIPIAIGSLVFSVVSAVIFIETWGLVGAAVTMDLTFALYMGAHLWVCQRLLRLPLADLAKTAVRSLLAAGAMALPLLAAGTEAPLSPLEWVAGGAGGLAAFVLVLLVTRELSPAELGAVRARLRRA